MQTVVAADQAAVLEALDTPVVVEVDDSVRPFDLDAEVTVDFTDVSLDEVWQPGKYPCRIVKLNKKTSAKKGIDYWALEWMVIAGTCKSKCFPDNCMLGGGGLKKTLYLYAALGLAVGGDKVTCKGRDLFEKEAWVTIVNTPDQKNPDKMRSQVDFEGYEPIDKYPLPDDNDPFQEAGQVGDKNPFEQA